MNSRKLLGFLTGSFTAVLLLSGSNIFAQTADNAEPAIATTAPVADAKSEMMAKFQEYATPGDNQKVLDAFAGSWDYTLKMWMSAQATAEESTGSDEAKWILGGRFLQHTSTGTSMGQPFEGIGMIGFDNKRKEYQSIWIDNMSTGMMTGKGRFDPETKIITESGDFTCPLKGASVYRAVIRLLGPDNYSYEMYMLGDDSKEFKAMEINYTRKK